MMTVALSRRLRHHRRSSSAAVDSAAPALRKDGFAPTVSRRPPRRRAFCGAPPLHPPSAPWHDSRHRAFLPRHVAQVRSDPLACGCVAARTCDSTRAPAYFSTRAFEAARHAARFSSGLAAATLLPVWPSRCNVRSCSTRREPNCRRSKELLLTAWPRVESAALAAARWKEPDIR
jgi:hypothetical protein